jgi:hypothetical protein
MDWVWWVLAYGILPNSIALSPKSMLVSTSSSNKYCHTLIDDILMELRHPLRKLPKTLRTVVDACGIVGLHAWVSAAVCADDLFWRMAFEERMQER